MGLIVRYAQAGGFAGLSQSCTLDTDRLPPDEASRLTSLVDRSDIFHFVEPRTRNERVVYDGMSYTLEVIRDRQKKTLHLRDGAIPPQLEELLNFVRSKATYQPGI